MSNGTDPLGSNGNVQLGDECRPQWRANVGLVWNNKKPLPPAPITLLQASFGLGAQLREEMGMLDHDPPKRGDWIDHSYARLRAIPRTTLRLV